MNTVTSKDGTTIAYDRTGSGPTLLLVGGALSHRADDEPLAALLAPHFTVYTYDRRGRIDSGDTPPYAVEREIEDIDALIQAAGGSAFVYGLSSGAVLALRAAAHGLSITKLALFEPPFILDKTRPPLPRDYVAHLNELAASGRRSEAVEYFMTVAAGAPPEIVAMMRQSPMWPGMEAVAHTLAYDGIIMGDTMWGSPEPLRQWTSMAVPTLVMDGGASEDWARHAVEELVAVLPNGQRLTLEGQMHAVDPQVLAPVLKAFFNS